MSSKAGDIQPREVSLHIAPFPGVEIANVTVC